MNRFSTGTLSTGPKLLLSLAFASAISLFTSSAARADLIFFDPDGAGGNSGALVNTFDFSVGNSIFQNLNSILVNKTNQATTHYSQASLGSLLDGNGSVVPFTGLGTTYELTISLGVDVLASVNGTRTTYVTNPSAAVKFFQIYYDSTPDANNLAGTGFDDGTLILSGMITSSNGVFNRIGSGTTTLDQFGPNNYPGVTSYRVSGGESVDVQVLSYNSNFFSLPVNSTLTVSLYNQSQVTPFNQTDPSQKFLNGSQSLNLTPAIGAVNGAGSDFMVQCDPNSSFIVQTVYVPEPSALAMGCLGLGALLAIAGRKQLR